MTPTMVTRYALPTAFLVAVLGMVLMLAPRAEYPQPAETGTGYITPYVTLDSLLAGEVSDAEPFELAFDASPAVDESAAHLAAVGSLASEATFEGDGTATPGIQTASNAHILTRDGLLEALAASPWPRHLWPTVIDIAYCESRWHVEVVGDQGRSFGLLQVHAPAHPRLVRSFDLLDVRDNLAAAYVVYLEAGSFRPWSCYR